MALRTGQAEEERVEETVGETPLERQEEHAETFLWLSGGLVVLMLAPMVLRRERVRRVLAVAGLAGTVALAGAAVLTGHSGGSLVYEHGAAAAYGRGQRPGSERVARFGHLPGEERAGDGTSDDR